MSETTESLRAGLDADLYLYHGSFRKAPNHEVLSAIRGKWLTEALALLEAQGQELDLAIALQRASAETLDLEENYTKALARIEALRPPAVVIRLLTAQVSELSEAIDNATSLEEKETLVNWLDAAQTATEAHRRRESKCNNLLEHPEHKS